MNLVFAVFPKIENSDDVAVGDLAREDQLLLEALQDFEDRWQARAG